MGIRVGIGKPLQRPLDRTPVTSCFSLARHDLASVSPATVLSIRSSHSFYIGRSPDCDFTIAHPAVSSKHCRLYALTVDTGEVLVCLEDTSTNGTLYNQRRVSRATTILSDGDTIESAALFPEPGS